MDTTDIRTSYNIWAEQYDSSPNKTRDLEGTAIRQILSKINFKRVLEMGCGTGKNTQWLQGRADRVLAVDFSEKMLIKAKEKIQAPNVEFIYADITQSWHFGNQVGYDLVVFSLVLEHIAGLESIFEQANQYLSKGGYIYIGELHPYKQYQGSQARFATFKGEHKLRCYTHNISDYIRAAECYDFRLELLEEYFDEECRAKVPRIICLLFRKK